MSVDKNSLDKKLAEFRAKIDAFDDQLVELLNQRFALVCEIGAFKKDVDQPVYRPSREKEILERLRSLTSDDFSDTALEAIFMEIFATARHLQKPARVGYLGPEGTFTHQAAEKHFGAISEYLPMPSIRAAIATLEKRAIDYAVVPVENSIDGVVGETLDELGDAGHVKIIAETAIEIHQVLASHCTSLADIRRIYSKDKAFGQCREFLANDDLESAEHVLVESTGKAAKICADTQDAAAICSQTIAKRYKLPVLYKNIESTPHNKTRFFILSADNTVNRPTGDDKTTILAHTSNKPGALFEFLQSFKEHDINLTKIESRPARTSGKKSDNFDAWFYIDFVGHVEDANVKQIMQAHGDEMTWLGSYARLT